MVAIEKPYNSANVYDTILFNDNNGVAKEIEMLFIFKAYASILNTNIRNI